MAPTTTPAAAHDLTATIAAYLDPQLLVPVLEHLADAGVHPKKDVLAQLYHVLESSTTQADKAVAVAAAIKAAGGKAPNTAALKARAETAAAALAEPSPAVNAIVDALSGASSEQLRTDRSTLAAWVCDQCQCEAADIDAVYAHGRAHYAAGNFKEAATILDLYRRVCTNSEQYLAAQWGRLAAHILAGEDQTALEFSGRVRDAIENAPLASQSHTLQQRLWLLHWSLFVYFRSSFDGALDKAMETLTHPTNTNVIETAAPHLLRYVVAASVLTSYKNTRDIARYAAQERYRVSDPLCAVYEHLFNNVDLDAVATALAAAELTVRADYFLAPHADAIMAGLRKQVLQVLGNVFVTLPASQLATYLALDATALDAFVTDLEFVSISADDVAVFSQPSAARRSVLDKVDKLSHRSDTSLASLYKKVSSQ
ncbi:hypothetical protein BC828DRAFT_374294 [Blastocladiella britannica]|nr:hypothetical protein BC828DRAFT_374294 [Blastocladiella britannica]